MKNKLPIILILGGVLIAGITWIGSQNMDYKSDAQIIQEAIWKEQSAAAEAAGLKTKVLSAPEECRSVTTKFIFDYAELEPDDFVSWPNWTDTANVVEQACILAALHQTNAHAFAIQRKEYTRPDPSNLSTARFINDVSIASSWTDDVDYGDTDASAFALITGFYVDRAKSRLEPGKNY